MGNAADRGNKILRGIVLSLLVTSQISVFAETTPSVISMDRCKSISRTSQSIEENNDQGNYGYITFGERKPYQIYLHGELCTAAQLGMQERIGLYSYKSTDEIVHYLDSELYRYYRGLNNIVETSEDKDYRKLYNDVIQLPDGQSVNYLVMDMLTYELASEVATRVYDTLQEKQQAQEVVNKYNTFARLRDHVCNGYYTNKDTLLQIVNSDLTNIRDCFPEQWGSAPGNLSEYNMLLYYAKPEELKTAQFFILRGYAEYLKDLISLTPTNFEEQYEQLQSQISIQLGDDKYTNNDIKRAFSWMSMMLEEKSIYKDTMYRLRELEYEILTKRSVDKIVLVKEIDILINTLKLDTTFIDFNNIQQKRMTQKSLKFIILDIYEE